MPITADPDTTLLSSLRDKVKAKVTSLQTKNLGLMEWCKKYLPHYFKRGFSPLHHTLCAEIDDLRFNRGRKELIIVPRGYAKTTFCSFAAPLKAVCEGTENYIIVCSDTTDMAVLYLKNIANELLYNEELRRDYPLACSKGETWSTERIETASSVCVEALGKGKNVRGRRFKQYRPTLVILDDPQSDDDVRSASTREKDVAWVDRALIPAGDTYTNYFVVGNNLHRESIVGQLATRPDFRVIKFSAIVNWPTNAALWDEWEKLYYLDIGKTKKAELFYNENKAMMEEGAVVLWPEKESLLELMQMRANMGHPAFAAEKLNEPRDPTKSEFPPEWFPDSILYTQRPAGRKYIVIGYCDPARGTDVKRGDYSAIITLFYDPLDRIAYVEADIKRRPVSTLIDTIFTFDRLYRYDAFGIESNGFQQLLSDELWAKAPRVFNVVPIENYGVHKNTRISRLSVWLQRQFYRFKQDCKDTLLLIQQLQDHPLATHDDGSDGLEGVTRLLTQFTGEDNTLVDPNANHGMSSDFFDDGLGDFLL
jgi:hypothetical protein